MKILFSILIAALFHITHQIYSQEYSNVTYDAGTALEIHTGADVCAGDIFINGTYSGMGTICDGPLPVELLSFTYSAVKNTITLSWATAFEINNSGFDIERAVISSGSIENWLKIGFIPGGGTVNQPSRYAFEDKKVNTGTHRYRLKQIDYNGSFEYFELTHDVIIVPPVNFSMGQNYPNPFNPKSKIDYEIPFKGKTAIKLYSILGEEVLSVVDEIKDAGYYTAEFDGTYLASGVYFYRITVNSANMNFTKTLKMILLR